MGYIKSKSNYAIKTKHQNTNDGTIYERDAVTIGGIDQFAPNQVPIYKSGNFILTINNESNPSKKISNDKWEENDNGVVWTLNDVKNIDDDSKDELNANIVIKKDYYSLKDFAYFGSCSELIRASINDILSRFPGEMYGTKSVVYYTDTTAGLSVDKTEIKLLGGGNLFVLENPFGINMHTEFLTTNQITDKLKYFCNDGYKNYEIYDANNKLISEVTSWSYRDTEDCKARKVGEITLNGTYIIYLYKGDGDILYYLYSGSSLEGIHIRPKTVFYSKFIETLDIFQKVIFNPNTEPKYKAVFEVISDNNFGYLTELKTFILPLGNGGYNIGSSSIPFEIYLKELSDIADYYDETFCDNLYRSMTHESIKNFDWTYNRNSTDDEADEYNAGGEKIAKLIRLFGRKFDDIKTYIDNIGNSNTVTYNDANNVPDYFLTDTLELDGWDVANIYSLFLNEYIVKNDIKLYRDKSETSNAFLNTFNKANHGVIDELTNKVGSLKDAVVLNRLFKQNLELLVKPYSIDNINNFKKGYFNSCCNPKKIEFVDGMSDVYIDECGDKPILRNLIKLYSNEKEYTADEINNAFMKRLKLNSKQLFRHKGTVEGIEMILSMFGLKSKKWCDKLTYDKKNILDFTKIIPDYEIKEYTSFANYILDEYRNDKKEYGKDWFNSTKLIQYNTVDYKNGAYVPYQGLPIAFREESVPNIKNQPRRLYPFFDKNEYYDGNPYYQMNGGWLKKFPYQFDKDNNIIGLDDNLFTETLRTVKSVTKIEELTTIPTQTLSDGDIYYVNNINSELAIVDGYPYEIKTEEYDNKVYQYFSVYTNNGSTVIGDVYFYDFINVSTPYATNKEIKIVFDDLSNNGEVKVYIIDGQIKAYSNDVTINNFQIFKNGNFFNESEKENRFTHYFRLNNIDYKSEISPYGWEQLANDDKDYYRLNAIVDYFKGNNPHNGNFKYDNGYDYLTYFKQIFKYAYNNELFDKRCYGDTYYEKMVEISKIGFNGLINDNDDCDTDYNGYMNLDSKIHYFGKLYTNKKIEGNNLFAYQTETTSVTDNNIVDYLYTIENDNNLTNNSYNLKNICAIHNTVAKTTSGFYGDNNSDGITHQIMNNKRIDIIFNVNANSLDKNTLEHVKYIDSVILPYMTQLLPPTAICTIKYEK